MEINYKVINNIKNKQIAKLKTNQKYINVSIFLKVMILEEHKSHSFTQNSILHNILTNHFYHIFVF